jgi:hypothetical protein
VVVDAITSLPFAHARPRKEELTICSLTGTDRLERPHMQLLPVV